MSFKQEKVIVIISEFVNDKREFYPITNVPVEKARFFYKDDDGLFKVMASSDYAVRTELNETRLYITNVEIKEKSTKFQVGYEINFTSSEYETSLPVLSVLVEMYNNLIEDSRTIFNYVKKQCFISDDKTTSLVLPNLPSYTVWCMGENGEMFALPVSELYSKFQKLIDKLYKEIKNLLDVDYTNLSDNLKKELVKHLLTLEEALGEHKDSLDKYTLEKIEEIKATCDRIIGLAFSKLTKADTIEDLKTMRFLKAGDIVEVLGYYEAGDGAGHKRIIANEDDGSGVQLANGLWANKLKSLKDINLINSTNFLRLLRNNMDNISFTLMGDSIWYLLSNGTSSPILGNGTSRIYNTMLEVLNEYIWKGKLTVAENLTFPGDDSSRAFTRYTEHQFKGDVVLICYGANDTKLDSGIAEGGTSFPVTNVKDTFDRHKKYMEKLIEKVILQGKVPIVIGCTAPKTPTQMQHRDKDPNRQNMVLMADLDKNIADEYGALYISAYDCMKNFDDSIFPGEDQVHPQDGLTHIGKRLANEFIGLMTDRSKYKTQVFGEINLGVRKTFDNFMVSSTESVIRKAPLQCWSNSSEYLDLQEGDCIVYSFYSPEDCIVYPQVIQENGSKITMGVNFNIFENKESKTFKDNNFDMYRRLQFDSTNNVPNRIMCFTSPKTYSIAQNLNTTGFRGMVVPFKLIPKGFNSFYIKSIEGSCKVLGITIEQVSNKVPSYNSSSFSKITSFNQLLQEGRYYFYRGSMTSLINDLPPNYNDDKADNFAFCDVKVAYDGNLSDPFFVQQTYSTRKGICVRNKTKQTDWGEWFYIRGGVREIWSIIKDFNEVIPQGEYYGATNHEKYNAILNKPDLKGNIIFKVNEIISVGYSLIAYSSSGIALRFYKNNNWEEWKYLKTNVI